MAKWEYITPSKWVKCIIQVEQSGSIFCKLNKVYEVCRWRKDENWMMIRAEGGVDLIKRINDNCFEFVADSEGNPL